ncbi:bifunctional 4-hydroxy-2-oxoglutarate aldolase/2-dehydro-3-deoxy-phosphogluconate aldolase [Alicyclobacillus suci]|uniref:bifunctional 4-hydroxy-2-oxoglutarate aldolase/2-dehydro-3-deoxy-phosphogluconate aldolase n=1 Tax=Alicyclobacillus suci TaxID=2816080 RepID=UPI001A8EB169|nr:bifunctional 4-hydroxy-2-oxoglutarate aldolase/2-dehydro-3-deoxy-phosphogluconate aldolase [Alicyclobacillus suci]
MSSLILSRVEETGVVAIIRGVDEAKIDPLVQALYDGGIRLVEVTLNTAGALTAISSLLEKYGEVVSIGAGTVLNQEQALQAKVHGAQFFVTPNVDKDVIRIGVESNIPVMSGALTPTEINTAYEAGATFVKVFPAGLFGAQYIREIRGPLSHIPLMAVGGVNLENARTFFDAGAVALGLGSSLTDKVALEHGAYDVIAKKARAFVDLYRGARTR